MPAKNDQERPRENPPRDNPDTLCPSCGARLVQEKCKLVCRSERCGYRIVFNCSEF